MLLTEPYNGTYTLELWSEPYGHLRTVVSETPTAQIPLNGLGSGTYFVKLIINNELVATEQLLIR